MRDKLLRIQPVSRLLWAVLLSLVFVAAASAQPTPSPVSAPRASVTPTPDGAVLLALDAEFSHLTSTSDDAIKLGMLTAIDEINTGGGVLAGRKLQLIESDNHSIPARGKVNFQRLAQNPGVVAVFTGKFSPVAVEQAVLADQLKLPLLDPWAAADPIIRPDPAGTYAFRLSLRDSWAVPAMLEHLRKRGIERVGAMMPTSGWGRSNETALNKHSATGSKPAVIGIEWYNFGTKTLLPAYQKLRLAGAQAIVLVANEAEGAILVREIARLRASDRLPVVSHWGVTGGNFIKMVGEDLGFVDFSVVQTFTFVGANDPKSIEVLARAKRLFGLKASSELPSHVGFAHAYDLTHLLARAIAAAGSTDRSKIRDALETLGPYKGLTGDYPAPFTPARHEAMNSGQVFIGRFLPSGEIERIVR